MVDQALKMYADQHAGEHPEELQQLVPEYLEEWAIVDPYSGKVFDYERTTSGYLLRCNGADQNPGGLDIPERDIVYTESGRQP